jgi:phosphatidylserine decarboxylase
MNTLRNLARLFNMAPPIDAFQQIETAMDSYIKPEAIAARLKQVQAYFHPAGHIFIALFAIVTVLLATTGWFLFVIGAVLTAWCAYFFRNPDRVTPTRPGLVVSPADGKVVGVSQVKPATDLGLGDELRWRVSIFLNVFDVHVNRIPVEAKVTARHYRPGAFMNASFDKASEDNERMALVLELSGEHPRKGQVMGCVQIAGLIARRIVCEAKPGDGFKTGERYGIIRFGSRTDLYLPVGAEPLVSKGQYMLGGETVIADFASEEKVRAGEVR